MTWRSVFLILTVCFFNLCHRCSALWADTTHTISRHCCIVNSLADTCRCDDKKEGNFHFFNRKEGENYTAGFARCEVNNVLFMQPIEPRAGIHRSGWTGAGWLSTGKEEREWQRGFAGKRRTNKRQKRKENNKTMQEWGKEGELEAKAKRVRISTFCNGT